MKREFLQLAFNYELGKQNIGSWFASEKLDGCRALWDGGITRGMYADQVPFANTEKDGRLLERPKATGLWSRYGKVIAAPGWWLDKLPPVSLDGELWIGHQSFQELISTVKKFNPGPEWSNVKYMVFDSPPYDVVFANGEINNTNFKKKFAGIIDELAIKTSNFNRKGFNTIYEILKKDFLQNEVFQILEQEQLPTSTLKAAARLDEKLEEITEVGGEGLILRSPESFWVPQRTRTALKVKKMLDAEGIVTGCTFGRKTELGSKLLGSMGALIINFNGKRLELSGFTDQERYLTTKDSSHDAFVYASQHEGEDAPGWIYPSLFPIGTKITFKYRELSDDGVPKEARYWRKK